MDIVAHGGKFAVSMGFRRFDYKWNTNNTLSVWSADGKWPAAHVTTPRGTYVEALNDKGEVVVEGGDGQWLQVPLSKKKRLHLRFKTLPDPKLTRAQIDKARQNVTRYLVSDKPYGLDIPETLPGAIAWMQKQLEAIPEAYRKSSQFEFGTTSEYGETYPQIEITYTEPESDAEVTTRIQIERERVRIKEASERDQLRKLKDKFETAT